MSGGGSFTSDQQALHKGNGTHVMRLGRNRITSVQCKGGASGQVEFHDTTTTGAVASGNLKLKYTFGTEGIDVYMPGSGVLFKDGIVVVLANSGGVTITHT
jgi:hypothetical protein